MEARPRINGEMLSSNIGKEVCIIGKIEQVMKDLMIPRFFRIPIA